MVDGRAASGRIDPCKVKAAAQPQTQKLVVESNAVTAHIAATIRLIQIYAYDMTRPSAVGQDALQDAVVGATVSGETTTLNLQNWVQPPGVSINDTIYLGGGGYVAIDKTSGTVANPGIALGVAGAKGVASKNLYFGWGWGAGAMWQSTDGGVNFSAMKGGPFQVGKLRISNDANGGVLYLVDNGTDLGFGHSGSAAKANAWRYVPQAAPSGSGLSPNTWTNLSATVGNWWGAVVPDSLIIWALCVCIWIGESRRFRRIGGRECRQKPGQLPQPGTNDPPWLAVTGDPFGQNFGDAVLIRWSLAGCGCVTALASGTRPTPHHQRRHGHRAPPVWIACQRKRSLRRHHRTEEFMSAARTGRYLRF